MREFIVPDWWSSYGEQQVVSGHSSTPNADWDCSLRELWVPNVEDPNGTEPYFSFNVVSRDVCLLGQQPKRGNARVSSIEIFNFCEERRGEFDAMRDYLEGRADELVRSALS